MLYKKLVARACQMLLSSSCFVREHSKIISWPVNQRPWIHRGSWYSKEISTRFTSMNPFIIQVWDTLVDGQRFFFHISKLLFWYLSPTSFFAIGIILKILSVFFFEETSLSRMTLLFRIFSDLIYFNKCLSVYSYFYSINLLNTFKWQFICFLMWNKLLYKV